MSQPFSKVASADFLTGEMKKLFSRPRKLLFDIVTIAVISQLYLVTTSTGLRQLNPAVLGKKLHRQPGLDFLKEFVFWGKLDIADITTFLIFLVCILVLQIAIRSHMYRDAFAHADPTTNTAMVQMLFRVGAVALCVFDTLLCFLGLIHQGMWGTGSVFSAIVFSGLYLVLILMTSAISVYLSKN